MHNNAHRGVNIDSLMVHTGVQVKCVVVVFGVRNAVVKLCAASQLVLSPTSYIFHKHGK